MVYRGYLLTRAADAGNRSRLAYLMALLASSVLFGYGHYYKGPARILQSTVSGSQGGIYWVPVIAQGFVDTIAIALVLLGLAD